MTTIAYRDGILAADSNLTIDGSRMSCAAVQKIHRLTPTRIVGLSGMISQSQSLLSWIAGGSLPGRRPTLTDVMALEINAVGETYTVTLHDLHGSMLLQSVEFFAIGSGHYYALGALAQGATPRQAVAAASRFDDATGGSVQTMSAREGDDAEINTDEPIVEPQPSFIRWITRRGK